MDDWGTFDLELNKEEGWGCGYIFQFNLNFDFIVKEEKDDGDLYKLSLTSSLFRRLSLPIKEIVRTIEEAIPEASNNVPDYGYSIRTNNLSEIFSWAEKMKVVLASLYKEYGLIKVY